MIRLRKAREEGKNMVIVCEDTHTAPLYLVHLTEQAIENGIWDAIEIYPAPPIIEEKSEFKKQPNPHKTARKKRKFEKSDEELDEWLNIVIEDTYKAQPVRYVRTAQKTMIEGGYTEGWAVFDLDGHAGHEQAAIIASQEPKVHIAFSSRALETWFLLHFGVYTTVFQKVHCKINNKVQNCNDVQKCVADDKGDCLVGFLRRNTSLKDYEKNSSIYTILEPNIPNAIRNAAELRQMYAPETAYYERNPYTSMDFLVKKLLNWVGLGDTFHINGFTITIQQTKPSLVLKVQNMQRATQILNKSHFALIDSSLDFTFKNAVIFEPNATKEIEIILPPQKSLLKCPANNEKGYFSIIY